MKKIIAVCLIISLTFALAGCSESEEYEVVGTLPEIVQGATDTENEEALKTTNSSESIQSDESVEADETSASTNG